MNRREHKPTMLTIGFNPRGYVDRSVPVLRIDAPGGRLRGVLFGAAAHNTTVHHRGPDGLMLTPEYALFMEKALGPRGLWLAGYCNNVFGYITTARQQRQGGYEAKGIFGQGFFAPAAQDVLVSKARELAHRADRPVPESPGMKGNGVYP